MSSRTGRWWRSLAPAAAILGLFFVWAPVVAPSRLLAARDVLQFFLPLRVSLLRLAAHGLPEWNPWIQGGQALLSDPSYAAWYPPTWLGFILGAARSIGWGAVLHAALAAVGAYRLARHWGARPEAASLAAIGFAAGGPFVSLVHAAGHLSGAAWLPWTLLATDRLSAAHPGAEARRATCALGLLGAALLLNGEPVTLLAQGLAAGALLVVARAPRAAALTRAAGAALLAIGLAAIQLLPALGRLAQTLRGTGLGDDEALAWSLTPLRLGELLIPHLFGDPARAGQRLWFGWGLVDRDYPFMLSLAPGLAVVLLAALGGFTRETRRRGVLASLALLGLALALGRHLFVLPLLRHLGTPFSIVRFPEKFFFLTGGALAFLAALGLERLLVASETRERGILRRFERASWLLLGALALATGAVLLAPGSLGRLLEAHAGPGAGAGTAAAGLRFYRHELLRLTLLAAILLTLAMLARRGRISTHGLAAGLVAVATLQLLALARPMLPTLPMSAISAPPELAAPALGHPGRLWSRFDSLRIPPMTPPGTGLEGHARAVAERLDPASGVIWGLSYALSHDYAETQTAPARRAATTADRLAATDSARFASFAGAWGIAWTLEPRGRREWEQDVAAGRLPIPARLAPLESFLPEVRWVAAATSLDGADDALEAALAAGLPLSNREFLVAQPGLFPERYDVSRTLAVVRDSGSRLDVEVGPGAEGLLVVAMTWDPGWTAAWPRGELPVLETAAGYLAIPVPADARAVTLTFRDPWLRVGGALSLATIALLALLALRWKRAGPL